jgi:hypothetical protein
VASNSGSTQSPSACDITNSGGVLSHSAVVAREYRIPAVVGTGHATSSFQDGQMLEVNGDAGTVRVSENTALGVALTQSLEMLMRDSGRRVVPIEVRPQMLYNPTMRSPNFFVPGVIGIVLQIGTTFATAMAVVRERERGTLEQLLVSPLSRWGLMLGKLVPYLCIGMLMAILLFAIMRFVFAVPIAGSVIAMMFSTLVYVFALLSLGLLVGTQAENP